MKRLLSLIKRFRKIFWVLWFIAGLLLLRIYYMMHIVNICIAGDYKSVWDAGIDQGGNNILFIKVIMLLYLMVVILSFLIGIIAVIRILLLPIPTDEDEENNENYFG